jgi:hypothetical protein
MHKVLFSLSLLALGLALFPLENSQSKAWFLFDHSASAGGQYSVDSLSELPAGPWTSAALENRIRTFPSEWCESDDLSVALSKIVKEVPAQASLFVVTDGRALTPLDVKSLADVKLKHLPAPRKLIRHVACPKYLDGKSALRLNVLFGEQVDPLRHSVSIVSESPMSADPVFNYLQEDQLQISLFPALDSGSFEFELLVDDIIHDTFQVLVADLPTITKVDFPIQAESLQALLDSGISCVIEYPTTMALNEVPAEYRQFAPATENLPLVICLLDVSGSMDGQPIEQAISALKTVTTQQHNVRLLIYPFSSRLHAPLNSIGDIDSLRPFGATDLSKVFAEAAALHPNVKALLLLSDGQSSVPVGGWQPQLAELYPKTDIVAMPCSESPHLESLQQIGRVEQQGNLLKRIQQAIEASAKKIDNSVHLLKPNFLSLADKFDLALVKHHVFESAPNSAVLYRDSDLNPVVVVRDFSTARLYSVAAAVDDNQLSQLSLIESQFSKQKKWILSFDGVFVYSPSIPEIDQDGAACNVRLIDASDSESLYFASIDPLKAVRIRQTRAAEPYLVNSQSSSEFVASSLPFVSLCASQEIHSAKLNAFPFFVSLLLFLGAYFVYHRKSNDRVALL